MASRAQLAANRRNARNSTGPKSELGKQVAALNALRHGLSASMVLGLDPRYGELLALLTEDGLPAPLARRLATTILDYERNDTHQRESFQLQFPGLGAGQDRTQELMGETANVVSEGTKLLIGGIPVLGARSPEVQDLRFLVEIARRFHRVFNTQHRRHQKNIRGCERDYQRARRYYKRAANQLAKSIRAGADPTTVE